MATTALAVVTVAIVAAVISYQHAYELVRSHGEARADGAVAAVHGGRADLGRAHGGTGRQSSGSAGTTAGRLEPGHRDRGHRRCQPGPWRGPRPGRSAGQRLARFGAGRLLRAAHDVNSCRAWCAGRCHRVRTAVPACTAAGASSATGTIGCVMPGADGSRTVRGGPKPARHCPRARHRPPKGQAHPRPSRMTPPNRLGAQPPYVTALTESRPHLIRRFRGSQ